MLHLSEATLNEIRSIAAEKGCRLLAAESGGAGRFSVLRLVLERADGEPVSIEQCEEVSREVSPLLDVSDEIAHRYTLEVSSAGLDRKLYSLEDAARFVGRRVRVRTETPVEPEATGPSKAPPSPSRNFQGILRAVNGDVVTVVDEENRKIYNVRFADIRLARLDFEWPDRGRRAIPK
jgi:ribosome maturation factor RimP